MADSRGWSPIAVTVVALAVINVANNRLLPRGAYVPFCIAAAFALVAYVRKFDGLTLTDMGLSRSETRTGLRWGAAILAGMFAIYTVGYLIPFTHDLFLDARVKEMTTSSVMASVFIRVPLGTVLLEEVAFRGVLLSQFEARTRWWVAMVASSVLFGFWHVLPSMGFESVNPVAKDTVGQVAGWVTVAGSVLFTGLAGLVFCWLRDRSHSLLAPMALHWSTNSLGYLFAWWAWR